MYDECWKDIPGFKGYQLSDLGRIRCFNKSSYLKKGDLYYFISPILSKRGRYTEYKVRLGTSGKNQKSFRMHRLLWELFKGPIPDKYEIDHINQNPLDNRLENLRLATHSENNCNVKIRANKKHSKYKGVSVTSSTGKYNARITKHGKTTALGSFDTEEEAARAYNKAATELHGEFAWLNPVFDA